MFKTSLADLISLLNHLVVDKDVEASKFGYFQKTMRLTTLCYISID